MTRQSSATFSRYGEGTLQLEGNAGLVVNVFTLDNWMETDRVGPSRFRPNGTSVLREAGMTYAFEGHVEWALGLSETSCYKVYTLADPPRLVVDVQK